MTGCTVGEVKAGVVGLSGPAVAGTGGRFGSGTVCVGSGPCTSTSVLPADGSPLHLHPGKAKDSTISRKGRRTRGASLRPEERKGYRFTSQRAGATLQVKPDLALR